MRPFPKSLTAAVALLLAACAAQLNDAGEAPDEKMTDVERDVARIAIDVLAADLRIPMDSIEVDSVLAVDWPDSSVGCPQPGMSYLQVITPGHKITLRANDRVHVIHEAKGNAFVCNRTRAAE